MQRREFITLLGGVVACAFRALPVNGYSQKETMNDATEVH